MDIKKDLVLREIAGDYALIPTGNTILKNNGLFSLTETAARLWELLPQARGESDLVDALLDEYDVDRPTAEADVAAFLAQLRELEIL